MVLNHCVNILFFQFFYVYLLKLTNLTYNNMGRKRLYTDEERKIKERERKRKYKLENPDKVKESNRRYRAENHDKIKERHDKFMAEHPGYDAEQYAKHKEKIAEYHAEYYKTPMGRANCLVRSYRRKDIKYNRGECTLTPEWIVDNIFPKPCHYCGETGWEIMGCDRIDNSKPHTPDNVVPCCSNCNTKRGTKDYEEFKLMIEDE